jgi:hypothetical protein
VACRDQRAFAASLSRVRHFHRLVPFLQPWLEFPATVRNTVIMLAPVQARVCPFCGLSTEVPHETQRGCIDALHAEIARTRGLLDMVKPVSGDPSTGAGEGNPQPGSDREPS